MSNIAWAPQEREKAYACLRDAGFTGLEIAPGLFFYGAEAPFAPSETRLSEEILRAADYGLQLVSMQSIFFGMTGVSLFGSPDERHAFVRGFRRAISLAARLGVPSIVVGSPQQRVIPAGMPENLAWDDAIAVFRTLGDVALAHGIKLSMEANPKVYGTNFLNTTDSVCDFVEAADHEGVGINFDLGALHLNGMADEVERLVERALPKLSHVHLSAPGLGPVPEDGPVLARLLSRLERGSYAGACSIEMKAGPSGLLTVKDCAAAVASAAALAKR